MTRRGYTCAKSARLACLVYSFPPAGAGHLVATQNARSAGLVGITHPPRPAAGVTSDMMHHNVIGLDLKNIIGGFRIDDTNRMGCSGNMQANLGTRWDFSSPPPNSKEFKMRGGPYWCADTHKTCNLVTNHLTPLMYATNQHWMMRCYWTMLRCYWTMLRCSWTRPEARHNQIITFSLSISGGFGGSSLEMGDGNKHLLGGGNTMCSIIYKCHTCIIGPLTELTTAMGHGHQLASITNTFSVHKHPFTSLWQPAHRHTIRNRYNLAHRQFSNALNDSSNGTHPPSHSLIYGDRQRHLKAEIEMLHEENVVFNYGSNYTHPPSHSFICGDCQHNLWMEIEMLHEEKVVINYESMISAASLQFSVYTAQAHTTGSAKE